MRHLAFWIFFIVFTAPPWLLFGQVPHPFSEAEEDSGLTAYWYNVPPEKDVKMGGASVYFQSSLHIYGPVPSSSFKVHVQVFLRNQRKVFEKSFVLDRSKTSEAVDYNNGYFRIRQPVEYLPENPGQIVVEVAAANVRRAVTIKCRYHKISGTVKDPDGNPLKAFILVCPDSFFEFLGKPTDEAGNFEIWLPARTYNALIANTDQYGISRLESWAWHMLIDSDQALNFTIGNGEVYNLNAWTSNGGDWTFFLTFRPMVLQFVSKRSAGPLLINNREFNGKESSPDLEAGDIKVTINGREVPIISVQKYYETGYSNYAYINYLLQVDRRGLTMSQKQSIQLEFRKKVAWQDKNIVCYGMGQVQLYLNYKRLSPIF